MPANDAVLAKQISSSALIGAAGKGTLLFGYSLSGTSVTVTFYDAQTGTGTIRWADSTSASAGQNASVTLPYPVVFTNGCYATISGGTLCVAYKDL
jgi:outer membrane protein assembly factor BamB